jgi:hypothetical protein
MESNTKKRNDYIVMDSLRKRQQKEVLDVWRNINSQVYSREKKQVNALEEKLQPLKTRDLEVEISLDKLVEQMNKTLESKLGSLENLITSPSLSEIKRQEFRPAFENITSPAEFIGLWNSLTRMYQTPGLSRTTQDQVKVKLQEVAPNIDAMCYGLNQYTESLFDRGFADSQIFGLLKTASVFRTIQQQIQTFSLQPITVNSTEPAYQEILSEQSEERISRLKEIESEGKLVRKYFPITNDFEDRYKGLKEVFGADLNKDELRKLPFGQLSLIAEKAGVANADRESIINAMEANVGELTNLMRSLRDIDTRIDEVDDELQGLEEFELEPEFKYADAEDSEFQKATLKTEGKKLLKDKVQLENVIRVKEQEIDNLQTMLKNKPGGLETGQELLSSVKPKGFLRKPEKESFPPGMFSSAFLRAKSTPKERKEEKEDKEEEEEKHKMREEAESVDRTAKIIEARKKREKEEEEEKPKPSKAFPGKKTTLLLKPIKTVAKPLLPLPSRSSSVSSVSSSVPSPDYAFDDSDVEFSPVKPKGKGKGKPKGKPRGLALMCESSSSSSESEDEELEAKRVVKKEKLPHYKRKMPFEYRQEKNDWYR